MFKNGRLIGSIITRETARDAREWNCNNSTTQHLYPSEIGQMLWLRRRQNAFWTFFYDPSNNFGIFGQWHIMNSDWIRWMFRF